MNYAIVSRDGFDVPLIGVPASSTEEKCDVCEKIYPLPEVYVCYEKMACAPCIEKTICD